MTCRPTSAEFCQTLTYDPNSDRLLTENGQIKTVSQGATLLATYYYDYQGRRTRKITTASAPARRRRHDLRL